MAPEIRVSIKSLAVKLPPPVMPIISCSYTFHILPFGLDSSQVFAETFLSCFCLLPVSVLNIVLFSHVFNKGCLGPDPTCCLFFMAHGPAPADLDAESWKPSQCSFHSFFPFHTPALASLAHASASTLATPYTICHLHGGVSALWPLLGTGWWNLSLESP